MREELKPLKDLLDLVAKETGVDTFCHDEPDEDSVGWCGDGSPMPMTFGHVRRAKFALEQLESRPEAAQVRVKTLTWSTLGADPSCIAKQFPYQIWPNNGGSGAPDDPFIKFNNFRVFEPFMMNCVGDEYETLDEAKAAAKADYDRRIRAALEPDTVTGWQDIATKLFCALDDIDTADDIAKDNEKLYRNLVRKAHKVRFEFQELFDPNEDVSSFNQPPLPPAPEKEG